jgi:hypothetical protein
MSYCRWSSDDFTCDLYAWHDISDNIVIHCSSNRRVWPEDLLPPKCSDDATTQEWAERFMEVMKLVDQTELIELDFEYAGERIACGTRSEAIEKFLELREIGYKFPDAVIEMLKAEIEEYGDSLEVVAG